MTSVSKCTKNSLLYESLFSYDTVSTFTKKYHHTLISEEIGEDEQPLMSRLAGGTVPQCDGQAITSISPFRHFSNLGQYYIRKLKNFGCFLGNEHICNAAVVGTATLNIITFTFLFLFQTII